MVAVCVRQIRQLALEVARTLTRIQHIVVLARMHVLETLSVTAASVGLLAVLHTSIQVHRAERRLTV